jgi:hypothetical protein
MAYQEPESSKRSDFPDMRLSEKIRSQQVFDTADLQRRHNAAGCGQVSA